MDIQPAILIRCGPVGWSDSAAANMSFDPVISVLRLTGEKRMIFADLEDPMPSVANDMYHLSLEPHIVDEKLEAVLATATNVADASRRISTRLSPARAYDLIEYAIPEEQETVLMLFEQLETGQSLSILSNGEECCTFTPEELLPYGFDPQRLREIRDELSGFAA